jgi:hypothetical protein
MQFMLAVENIPGELDVMAFEDDDSLFQIIETLKPYLFHIRPSAASQYRQISCTPEDSVEI